MSKTRSLYDDIDDAMELRNDASARFLPAERLGQLLTKEAVTTALEPYRALLEDIDMEALVCFVCAKARIAFATLVWNEDERLILGLYRAKFTDDMLPVIRSGQTLSSLNKRFTATTRGVFSSPEWRRRAVTNFYDQQWLFLSPVFRKNRFHYKLPGQHHMPFLQKIVRDGGRYGEVTKCILHRDHLDIDFDVMHNENRQPIIAIKELKKHDHWSDKDFKDAAKREADVLKMMREFPHEHIIKIIAYCEMNERRYFLFPWAEYGNLQQYWNSHTPSLDEAYLKWVFSQLMGLAGAIQELHEKGECRHGDIKPQNILCFKDTSSGLNNYPIRLVIADLGLAKVHDQATLLRSGVTTTKNHTVMYSAPEAEFNIEPRSRLYDVWSIGCTYLEFVIWLLWLKPELDRFQMEVGGFGHRGTFYDIQPGHEPPARVHSTVQEWIIHIQNDPRCTRDTGLRRLIDLIAKRLLIVALPGAAPKPRHLNRQASNMEDSFRVLVQPPTFNMDATSDGPVRATAKEMYHELRSINSDFQSGCCKLIDDSKSEGKPPRSSSKLTLPSSTTHAIGTGIRKLVNEYAFTALTDDWEYIPDDDFARQVFTDLDPSSPLLSRGQVPALCPRCINLPLWSATCSFSDTLIGLKQKMDHCALCRLLIFQCIRIGIKSEDQALRFIRASSYLRLDGQGKPVASLCTGLQSRKMYLQSLQLGCPKLVDPGSATHINLMIEWIKSCDEHGCYPHDTKFFPTRVIDVDCSSGTVRLISKTKILREAGRYVALSHRWGPPTEHRAFCTLKKDIEGRDERILEINALPRTFQDAIHITRKLGMLHLWIDSLCIIQDDKDDWNRESQLMEQVYSSAYCTIAATCAAGFDDGFLKPRPERQYVTMKGPDSDKSLYYVCEPIDDFHSHVDQSELNKRGWVLQERALSRRTIHFTETQTYWECGKGVRCETLTKMKNQKASFLGDSNFPYSAEDYVKGKKIKLIQSLYERYSNMALTVPSDRPFAIKGLESRLVHTFGGTGQYGVLQIYLHRCLLWKRSEAPLKPITTFKGETIPSWSWMAYEGGIQYIDAPGSDVHWRDDVIWSLSPDESKELNTQDKISRELRAPVWDLVNPQDEDIILDEEYPLDPQTSKCVIIGVSKRPADEGNKLHYVLIVTPISVDEDLICKRLGVGVMKQRHIALDRQKPMARIQ